MIRYILSVRRIAATLAFIGIFGFLSCLSIAVAPIFPSYATAAQADADEITLAEAKTLFDGKKACFVDARPEYLFSVSHIKGARSLSSSRFFEQIPEFRKQIPAETLIVVYCVNDKCGKAHYVARMLRTNGFRNVRVFEGGIVEWNKAGYPLES
ncbi:MAG TPA: rhodanese-like domain-containing protein [Chlorobaculum sp.]|nr:rhodanese-like domain-containing protein [Chlorobaculum sp.]